MSSGITGLGSLLQRFCEGVSHRAARANIDALFLWGTMFRLRPYAICPLLEPVWYDDPSLLPPRLPVTMLICSPSNLSWDHRRAILPSTHIPHLPTPNDRISSTARHTRSHPSHPASESGEYSPYPTSMTYIAPETDAHGQIDDRERSQPARCTRISTDTCRPYHDVHVAAASF